MKPSVVKAIYLSVIRRISDLIEEINTNGSFGIVSFHNFENRTLETQLPHNTIVGIDGFSFDENAGLWLIRLALAISSYEDKNLLNEIDLLDFIHQRFGEGEKINLLNTADASIDNELVVTAFQIMPMAQSEIRNYRTIGIELKRTGT